MRYEYTCSCEASIALECDTDDYNEIEILESRFEMQVATHISSCRKALQNYAIKEVVSNE